ncbi:MAG: glycosyltransferase [Pelagibacterales bacterium]|nr:glycosyltransferase [Pelagibacterales bacterium]|tara:strand:- start:12090 stop:12836 length:747 start_codon:yes stop_codon:yes gene_type:complete
MSKKINFLNIPLDVLTMDETINKIDEAIFFDKQIHHCVINAGKVVQIHKDKFLRQSVLESDLINADGMSIVWAAKYLGYNIPERVAGIDLMEKLVELSHKKKYKCFFFGAKENIVKKLVNDYSIKYSKDLIAGYRNGYYNKSEEFEIVKKIQKSNANILFVAMTSPKKENFLYKYKVDLRGINFIMGVGGSFDVISGKINRAPRFMQYIGLEWFYRLVQEPIRLWRRYTIDNFKFLVLVFKSKFQFLF